MSRRYPVQAVCPDCGRSTAQAIDGRLRPHGCRGDEPLPEWLLEEAPWPAVSIRAAAKQLGVTPELLDGLKGTPRLRAAQVLHRDGHPTWVLNADDVASLADHDARL